MTSSIANLNSSSFYQLSNPSAGTGTSAAPNATDALLQALSSIDSNSNSNDSNNDAFLLDLSPQAQNLLSGANGSGSSSLSDILGGGNFILSAQQQQQITAILTKYKDAPYNQDTFNQIQSDLQAAGLGPDVLSMKDQATSFDPALVLLDALNGTNNPLDFANGGNEQTKTTNYMQGIISQWQNISGNTGQTPTDTTTTGSA